MSLKKTLKISLKIFFRYIRDIVQLSIFRFVSKQKEHTELSYSIELVQSIKPSTSFDNKIFNIRHASNTINQYLLMPNQIFSFWHIIGNPNNNYKEGRSIKNGILIAEKGGGLCQVAGIIYHISLIAGLKIVERHNHSIDIYTEETRYSPLGVDATVVYGYKDLRLINNLSFPIKFDLTIADNQLIAKLFSSEKIEEKQLFFETNQLDSFSYVEIKDLDGRPINKSKYRKLSADEHALLLS